MAISSNSAEMSASLAAKRTSTSLVSASGSAFACSYASLPNARYASSSSAFFAEICAALRLADRVMIADIYAARETDRLGMSAEVLAAGVGERASAEGSFRAIADALVRELAPGDLAVVMGAGDIDRLFGEFSGKHFTL